MPCQGKCPEWTKGLIMKQKIIGLGFGPGGYIGIGDRIFSGKDATQCAVVALITDNSIEYPDAMHRIYAAYTSDNQMISSFLRNMKEEWTLPFSAHSIRSNKLENLTKWLVVVSLQYSVAKF